MKCKVCGRQIQNEAANFCEYCGSSCREHFHTTGNPEPREQYHNITGQAPYAIQNQYKEPSIPKAAEPEKPMSLFNWVGTYGLLFIPFVGWLIFIVMLFVWAFSGTTPTSKKNWARGTLIFVAVLFVLFIAYMMVIMSTPMFRDMMNGTFDYNSFYQELYGTSKQ